MKDSSYHFVNVDKPPVNKDLNSPENNSEDEDVLSLPASEQGLSHQFISTEPDVSKPQYYYLDKVVFAEPINETPTATEESGFEETGEITFVDNVIVKKRPGKRNRYLIDIKDGCLDCPMSNCTQTFGTRTLLKAHVRKVHCATTKYVCEECGAGFTAQYLLKRHSAVHSGSKVQCTVCEKWLSQRTDLSVHMRTHGAARLHACAACGKRFLRHATLRRHQKFVHRDHAEMEMNEHQ